MANDDNIRVLFIGEIVGKAGLFCIKSLLPDLKKEFEIDFTIAAAEGVTGGYGIGKTHAIHLKKLGVDIITTGDFAFFKRDITNHFSQVKYMLRPANFPKGTPGRGCMVFSNNSSQIGIISLLGQSGFSRIHLRNPFEHVTHLVNNLKEQTPIIILDFHAATTAEKIAMSLYLDGKVSAVLGSHVRTMSSDSRILPKGTATITHSGRTGSLNSVAGLKPNIEIRKFITQIYEKSEESWDLLGLQGVVLDLSHDGKAHRISPVQRQIKLTNNSYHFQKLD